LACFSTLTQTGTYNNLIIASDQPIKSDKMNATKTSHLIVLSEGRPGSRVDPLTILADSETSNTKRFYFLGMDLNDEAGSCN
jgi:hypothetical protein